MMRNIQEEEGVVRGTIDTRKGGGVRIIYCSEFPSARPSGKPGGNYNLRN